MYFLKRFSKKKNCADSLESPPKSMKKEERSPASDTKKSLAARRSIKKTSIEWM